MQARGGWPNVREYEYSRDSRCSKNGPHDTESSNCTPSFSKRSKGKSLSSPGSGERIKSIKAILARSPLSSAGTGSGSSDRSDEQPTRPASITPTKTNRRVMTVTCARQTRTLSSNHEFNNCFQIDADPGVFAHISRAYFDFPQRGLDRDRAVSAGDGGCSTSDEAAAAHADLLPALGTAVASAHHHRQRAFQ
jgi:hypothetical protein